MIAVLCLARSKRRVVERGMLSTNWQGTSFVSFRYRDQYSPWSISIGVPILPFNPRRPPSRHTDHFARIFLKNRHATCDLSARDTLAHWQRRDEDKEIHHRLWNARLVRFLIVAITTCGHAEWLNQQHQSVIGRDNLHCNFLNRFVLTARRSDFGKRSTVVGHK